MALKIEKPDQPLGLVADRPLKLAADNYTLVEAYDDKGRYNLVGTAGAMISAEDAHRLHLTTEGGRVVQMSRDDAYKASGQEVPASAEAPKAEWLVKPTPPPPPPPPENTSGTGATPQTPPSAPAAVPADAKGKAASNQTVEEKVRLRDRAERMSSGDVTTPTPKEGEPLRSPAPEKPAPAKPASKTTKKTTKRGKGK